MQILDIRHLPGGALLAVGTIDSSDVADCANAADPKNAAEPVDSSGTVAPANAAPGNPSGTKANRKPVRRNFREAERTAVRKLLAEITGDNTLKISYEESGRPLLSDGRQISISHTRGYAAVIISPDKAVGIDIEYQSDRVGRITSKFIRDDEQAADILSQLLLWSAKETVFKLFSSDKLEYFEMKSHPFEAGPKGTIEIENLKRNIVQQVFFESNKDYVLTYAIG